MAQTEKSGPSWMHPDMGTYQKGQAGNLSFSLLTYQPHTTTALSDKSSPVLKKLSCITVGIAPGGKVCRGGGLSLVDSLEEQQGETLVSRLHLATSGRSEPTARGCGLPVPRLQEAQPTGL